MNTQFWDGDMDYGWEDLSEYLKNTCKLFTGKLEETALQSANQSTKELINSECIERFYNIVIYLCEIIKEGYYYQAEDDDVQNAKKLTAWILLGSLTESMLQMFLSIYIDDYKNEGWMLWVDFEIEKVQPPIIECINNLESNGILEKSQSQTLKKSIKESIKEHTREHQIQKIMLDELIQLFTHINLMDEDEIDYLRTIQSNRNGIHSFQSRSIGDWFNLQYCTRFFGYLMEWFMNRLPNLIDYSE